MADDTVQAFVPGHITGFFSPHPDDDDPTQAGSRGGGLTLADGVRTSVEPAEESTVVLDGEPIEIEPVERVLRTLNVSARVTVDSDLPLGAGFGVSGAMSLGTALAVNRAFDRRLSENELVTIAHGAEVLSGTGLGDVVAQARGGIPIRLEPGAPEFGKLDGIPRDARVEYHTFGDLSTADVLGSDTTPIEAAGKQALSRVVKEPTLSSFIYASREFTREAGLLTRRVRDAVADVAEAGGHASMAMIGDTVFALGTGLTDAGYDAEVTRTHPAGAMFE